jgi:hypothetical protein
MSDSVEARANGWITGDDTGASSKTLWGVMMGSPPKSPSSPSDGGDLGRCLRLLELIPEWRARLGEMSSVSPYWAALVKHWDELSARHAQDRDVYQRMRQILDPIEKADPNVFRMGPGVTVRFGR